MTPAALGARRTLRSYSTVTMLPDPGELKVSSSLFVMRKGCEGERELCFDDLVLKG